MLFSLSTNPLDARISVVLLTGISEVTPNIRVGNYHLDEPRLLSANDLDLHANFDNSPCLVRGQSGDAEVCRKR